MQQPFGPETQSLLFPVYINGVIQAFFAITLSRKPAGCQIAETSGKTLPTLHKNLAPPSSGCAITQVTTTQNFTALKSSDMNRTPDYNRSSQLRNECVYRWFHCTRDLSYSYNCFFVYEHEPLSFSSYSIISHVSLSSISSSLPQVLCTSWVNYLRILEKILTLKRSCHFLHFVHSPQTMTVLSPATVIAFCICLSCQSQSSARQGSADTDITQKYVLLHLISCSSLDSHLLSYICFLYGPIV